MHLLASERAQLGVAAAGAHRKTAFQESLGKGAQNPPKMQRRLKVGHRHGLPHIRRLWPLTLARSAQANNRNMDRSIGSRRAEKAGGAAIVLASAP